MGHEFIITCHTGFEEYSEEEAMELGANVLQRREGRIIIEGSLDLIYSLNGFGRTFHKVILLVSRANVKSLEDIYRTIRSLDFSFIGKGQTFAVRSERSGLHSFTSLDMVREAGRAIIDSYLTTKGTRLKVDLDRPDVIITADLIGDELFVGVDTTGESLHIREYRRYNHPSALKPSLASALIRMSGWRGEPLLDPFTGGATIPIEAALRAKAAPVRKRKEFMYRRLSFYNREEEVKILERPRIKPFPVTNIVGIEKKYKHYKGALKNVETAEVEGFVKILYEDSLKYRPKEPFDFIITNPPYGIKSGRKDKVLILYRLFLSRLPNLLKEGGKFVLITTEHKPLKRLLEEEGYRILKENMGRHGKLWVKAFLAG
jgi:tRNA (guanine6-N2)-methyltransferase